MNEHMFDPEILAPNKERPFFPASMTWASWAVLVKEVAHDSRSVSTRRKSCFDNGGQPHSLGRVLISSRSRTLLIVKH